MFTSVFLPISGVPEQFAVSLQSRRVKGAGRYRSRHSSLVRPSTEVLVMSVVAVVNVELLNETLGLR